MVVAKVGQIRSTPFRIDVHHHTFPAKFMANQEKRNPKWGPQAPPIMVEGWTPQLACDALDKAGIATAIVQMKAAPGVWFGDVAAARDLAREWNEYTAQMTRDFRGRFGMFAVLPLPDIDTTLREIEYAFDVLQVDGVQLMSHYEFKYPGDQRFWPVLEELNNRKAVVFVHPFYLPPSHDILPGVRPATIEFPFDSTRALVSLVLSGATSRFADVRFIFCHGGGTLPMLAGRIAELTKVVKGRWVGEVEDEDELARKVPNGIEHELKRLYFEMANAYYPPSFRALHEFAPESQILFGTDFPFLSVADHANGLRKVAAQETVQAIERDNALALFGKFATAAV
jgi:predicted TIM-barrel fold metal-dependent hydrolase